MINEEKNLLELEYLISTKFGLDSTRDDDDVDFCF